MCPSDLRVSVDVVQGDGFIQSRMERVLWQLTSTHKGASDEACQEWKIRPIRSEPRTTPLRKALHGPVGAFLDHLTLSSDISSQELAIRVHSITATEKLHFDGLHEPFTCYYHRICCDAYFDQAEDFTTHIILTFHDGQPASRLYNHQYHPDSIKKLFIKNQERLDHLTAVARQKDKSFVEWWGGPGSEEERAAKKEFMHQLEHDPLYAQAPEKSVEEHHLLDRVLDRIETNNELVSRSGEAWNCARGTMLCAHEDLGNVNRDHVSDSGVPQQPYKMQLSDLRLDIIAIDSQTTT